MNSQSGRIVCNRYLINDCSLSFFYHHSRGLYITAGVLLLTLLKSEMWLKWCPESQPFQRLKGKKHAIYKYEID